MIFNNMDYNNQLLWIFKEPRSGSVWFCDALEKRIHKKCIHFDVRYKDFHINPEVALQQNLQFFSNTKHCYASHNFEIIKHFNTLHNPTLIRTTRKNKAEQVMSFLYFNVNQGRNSHMYVDDPNNLDSVLKSNMSEFIRILKDPITVTKKQVLHQMKYLKKLDDLWNNHKNNFVYNEIFYEDLYEGVNLSVLDLKLKFDDEKTFVNKTPDYKKQLFYNYDQIVEWCENYTKELGFNV